MSPRGKDGCLIALRIGFAALFIWAAVPKLVEPATFARAVAAYRLLPETGIQGVAWVLPWLELLVGLSLLALPWLRRGAWLLATALMVCFAAIIASAAARGLDIGCGCFGGGDPVGFGDGLPRLAAAVAAGIGFAYDRPRPENGKKKPPFHEGREA